MSPNLKPPAWLSPPVAKGRDRPQPRALPAVASGPVAVAALATGALAFGALAIGALAIGALAIGRLRVRQLALRDARLGRVEIDELIVRRLTVIETVQPAIEASAGADAALLSDEAEWAG